MRGLPKKALDLIEDPTRKMRAASRECGDCTYCCTWMRIEEVESPPGERCEHIVEEGCAIYGVRPKSCRVFYCTWRLGYGKKAARPDRCRMVATLAQTDNPDDPDEPFIRVDAYYEPNAEPKMVAKDAIIEMVQDGWLVRVYVAAGDPEEKPIAILAPENHKDAAELMEWAERNPDVYSKVIEVGDVGRAKPSN